MPKGVVADAPAKTAAEMVDSAVSLTDMMDAISGGPGDDTPEVRSGSEELQDAEIDLSHLGLDDPEQDEDQKVAADNEAAAALLKGAETGDSADGGQKPAEAATPASTAISDAELATLRESADFGSKWAQRFETDPAGVTAALITSLPAHLQKQVLSQAGLAASVADPQAAALDDKAFEGLTPQEVWVEKNKASFETIRALPEQVDRAFMKRDEIYGDAAISTYRQEAVIEGLVDLLGLTVPALDNAKLTQALQSGKTLQAAVREQVDAGIKDAVARAKQKSKAADAPNTPTATSGGAPEIKSGDSLAKIMKSNGWL